MKSRNLDELKAALASGQSLRASAALDEAIYEARDPEEAKAIGELVAPLGEQPASSAPRSRPRGERRYRVASSGRKEEDVLEREPQPPRDQAT